MPSETHRKPAGSARWHVLLAGGGAVVALCLVYAFFDPALYRFFPRCPFYVLTGLQCPGCGSQRALHQLLCGNLPEAFRANALFVLSLPALLFILVAESFPEKFPRWRRISAHPAFAWTVTALLLLWWIGRNL